MSTVTLKEEIEAVHDALCYSLMGSQRYHHAVFDRAAAGEIAVFGSKPTVDDQKNMIWSWCNRVYIANQIAYILTYAHHPDCNRAIEYIADSDHCNGGGALLQKPSEFYNKLQSIRYNLYSNGGQCMLNGEDMARLDNLIAAVAAEIISAKGE